MEEIKMSDNYVGVDFDGVLHTYHGWTGPVADGEPTRDARRLLTDLRDMGCIPVVFSTRGARYVWEWLQKFSLDSLVEDVTSVKWKEFMCFIDDRNIRYEGDNVRSVLQQVDQFVEAQLPWWKVEREGDSSLTQLVAALRVLEEVHENAGAYLRQFAPAVAKKVAALTIGS